MGFIHQMTESEFDGLERVRDNLGLIAGLLNGAEPKRGAMELVTAGQLMTFVWAQFEAIEGIAALISGRGMIKQEEPALAQHTEPAAPEMLITPELLTGLMDAASGELVDSAALIGLYDDLSNARERHRPYVDALHHFLGVLKGRGLALRVEFFDDKAVREFVAVKPQRGKPAKVGVAKPRKR